MSVPEPTEKLYCRPAKWTDVVIFFLVNIIAHAATVPPSPGSTTWGTIQLILSSIFIPYFGAKRAAVIISRGARWPKNPLEKAARAGALCVVGRTRKWRENGGVVISRDGENHFARAFSDERWEYENGDRPPNPNWRTLAQDLDFSGWQIYTGYRRAPDRNTLTQHPEVVHGQTYLTPEYAIYYIDDLDVEEFPSDHRDDGDLSFDLSSSHSFVKPLVSVFQITYASITLYRARGDQINRYGYGAYSFIVVPYIFMSFMNLAASLFCPEYPCLFLVESEIMSEARGRGCFFSGVVGRVRSRETGPAANIGRDPVVSDNLVENSHPIDIETQRTASVVRDNYRSMRWGNTYDGMGCAFLGRISFLTKTSRSQKVSRAVALLLMLSSLAGPIAIVGLLSHFQCRRSTPNGKYALYDWALLNYMLMGIAFRPMLVRNGFFVFNASQIRKLLSKGRYGQAFSQCLISIFGIAVISGLAFFVFGSAGKKIMEDEVCVMS